jgi:hypothetical protein
VHSGESDAEGHRREAVPFRLFPDACHPAETGSVAFPVAMIAMIAMIAMMAMVAMTAMTAMTVPAVVTVPAAIRTPTVVAVGPGVAGYLEAGGRGSGGLCSSVR